MCDVHMFSELRECEGEQERAISRAFMPGARRGKAQRKANQ